MLTLALTEHDGILVLVFVFDDNIALVEFLSFSAYVWFFSLVKIWNPFG